MNETQKWQRSVVYASSGGVCEVCGKPLLDGQRQGAHRIANTKANRIKWGSVIIDHPLNMAATCSLGCNSQCNIGQNPGKCWELVLKIAERELKKYGR